MFLVAPLPLALDHSSPGLSRMWPVTKSLEHAERAAQAARALSSFGRLLTLAALPGLWSLLLNSVESG